MKGTLLSIRPKYTELIFNGKKTAELRRKAPACCEGDVVIIYETSPRKAIVGRATIERIESNTPKALWRRVKQRACVEHNEYVSYFNDTDRACAIYISDIQKYKNPIQLSTIRERHPEFRPPQSWCYLERLPKKILRSLNRQVVGS